MFAGEDPSAASGSGTKGRAVVRTCGGRRNLEATRLAQPTRPRDASAEPCQTSGSGGVGTTGATLGQPRARDRGAWEQL